MANHTKIVLDYLMTETPFTVKQSFIDRLHEINEGFETVPEEVIDAYQELTNYELWEIIRKVACEGKRRNKEIIPVQF
ncbi:hypothetical protein OM416_19870 [Paenibacillus sp. LS1]|uniref:hypothetical protein n=1 Tax=Paenibacillus sp. LS1 TaxID=2992120 RepID=UPI0022317926|nr:hypothetical protein [Paenibacillus sp. LS1]MCW3793854.1 hypothetical protein [Paenibacillus sp. LS1]